MDEMPRRMMTRRLMLLSSATLFIAGSSKIHARIINGELPWIPNGGNPPAAAQLGPWTFFSGEEGRTIEALADRIIPPDPETPGGKDSGSAVFIDRQLAGPYGQQDGLYVRPPFQSGTKSQGHQSEAGPRELYRKGLEALNKASKDKHSGQVFADLSDADTDALLQSLERGDLRLDGIDGKAFFEQAIKDVQMGFFADPIYGGNRDMAAWKMIGYPGARYNYLDWVKRRNERFPLPPVSMTGRADWNTKSEAR
jgi:gluconate 2-dehydrogenase gamma chain